MNCLVLLAGGVLGVEAIDAGLGLITFSQAGAFLVCFSCRGRMGGSTLPCNPTEIRLSSVTFGDSLEDSPSPALSRDGGEGDKRLGASEGVEICLTARYQ